MKKILTLFAAGVLALALISCGKKIDSSNWLSSLDDAKKAAVSESKNIFLFFSADDTDGASVSLKEKIFSTEEFLSAYTDKYVLVNIDFSDSRYEAGQDALREDMKVFERYNAGSVPYFLILSKEGFVITRLAFDPSDDFESVKAAFSGAEGTIARFEETLARTKTGTTEERLDAINEIFDSTEPALAYHLTPLNEMYLSLDKGNASGQSSKHIIALAYAKAEDFFLDDEPQKASDEFARVAKNKVLTADERQMAYYTAGYLLAQSGSTEFAKIKDYFNKAYDAAPDSEEAANIKIAITYIQMMIDGEGDDAPSYDDGETGGSDDAPIAPVEAVDIGEVGEEAEVPAED